MGDTNSFGGLRDVRILDLTQMLAGPFATMLFADHGAQVIKVEPLHGEMSRPTGPFHKDDQQRTHGGYFQSINRNKQSICLDLKSEQGKETLKRLIPQVDAIVVSFRSGVMDRLGLGYEDLKVLNPKLVYGSLSGFGDQRTGSSPYADWPAYDVVAQAMGGIMSMTGADSDSPTKIGPGLGDIVPGLFLAFGLLTAIHNATRTGEGQFVDVAMIDGVLAVCERMVYQKSFAGEVARPQGNHHPFICPFGMFPARDGFVTIAAQHDLFKNLCTLLGMSGIAKEPRFSTANLRTENHLDLITLVSEQTKQKTKSELTEILGGEVPFGPIFNIKDIENNAHFKERNMLVEVEQPGLETPLEIAGVPIKLSKTPGGVHRRAPYLGEDTYTILREAGLTKEDIALMVASGVSKGSDPTS